MNGEDENQTHPRYLRMVEDCEADEAKEPIRRERKDVDCPGCLNEKEAAKK